MAANLESAREQTRRLRFAIDLETEQARLELKSATERLAVTEQTTVQAAESAALTRARFEARDRCAGCRGRSRGRPGTPCRGRI